MLKRICIFFLCGLLLVGCHSEQSSPLAAVEKPESLTVYATGTENRVANREGYQGSYFSTPFTMGPLLWGSLAYGEEGHILHSALQNYTAQTGILLDLHFFSTKLEMEETLREDQRQQTLPDVVLLDNYTFGDDNKDNHYRLLNDGWFYDLTPFMEENEIYDSQEYYNEVLRAGIWKGAQRLIPLHFNLSAIFTSHRTMEESGIFLQPDMSFADMVRQLGRACREIKNRTGVDFLVSQVDISMIAEGLLAASGSLPANYETGEIAYPKEDFAAIAELYLDFLQMEYSENWEERQAMAAAEVQRENWFWSGRGGRLPYKSQARDAGSFNDIFLYQEWLDQGAFYVEGGNSLKMQLHSFIGQAVMLHSLYAKNDEKLAVFGIPTSEEEGVYTALVQLSGGVIQGSQHPEYGFDLLKYLMDQTYFPYCAIPVKKDSVQAMLETLSTQEYSLDVLQGMFSRYDGSETYQMILQPLGEEIKEEIEQMLDHIGAAVLPNFSGYIPLMKHLEGYALGAEDMDTAYQKAVEELQTYVNEYLPPKEGNEE